MSTPVLCYRLSLAKPKIPFFLLQLLGSSLLMTMPDLLIWNIVFFFFWNFWVSALIAEFWPMTIYNRQFYSKVFQKCPCSSKRMHNDLLCPGSCWVFLPGPLRGQTSGLGCEAPLCLPSVFSCSELCQLGTVGDRWVWGTDLENISHLTTFLYFTGGEAEDNLEGSK